MTRALVATPDPQRPRNAATWTNSTTTAAVDGTGGGNGRNYWLTINAQR